METAVTAPTLSALGQVAALVRGISDDILPAYQYKPQYRVANPGRFYICFYLYLFEESVQKTGRGWHRSIFPRFSSPTQTSAPAIRRTDPMFVALTLASPLELHCLLFLFSASPLPVRIEPKMGRCRLGQNTAAAVLLGLMIWLKRAQGGGWEEKVKAGKEKVTRLHFYLHDQVTGKNATAVQVASAPSTKLSQTQFGEVSVIDDLLTEGPHPASKLVGRAQGFYSLTGQTDVCLLMAFNIVLQGGEFNGSTLSVLGKNEVSNKVREMPIVGGSGAFSLARGYCLAQTHSLNLPDSVIQYNVTVFHY